MEPLEETRRAFEEFGTFDYVGHSDLPLSTLLSAAEQVRALVPCCVGVSLTLVSHGVTFTVQATAAETAALDGVQDLEGSRYAGEAPRGQAVQSTSADPTDEIRWQTFASAAAADGVAATLTLPVLGTHVVMGVVDLYAATPAAFDGVRKQVAAIFDAWAPGAVTNADLGFDTRRVAQQAPAVLAQEAVVHQAIGLLMSRHGLDVVRARGLLSEAAARDEMPVAAVARAFIEIVSRSHNHDDAPR